MGGIYGQSGVESPQRKIALLSLRKTGAGTGCGVSFQISGNELQAKVTSGSIACLVKVETLI